MDHISNNNISWKSWERTFSQDLFLKGWWVLNIPRNNACQQPFDVIALKGNEILAADCKVCAGNSFPLYRIEDDQWLSFRLLSERTQAKCGFAIICSKDGTEYWLSYKYARTLYDMGKKSIKLTEELRYRDDMLCW